MTATETVREISEGEQLAHECWKLLREIVEEMVEFEAAGNGDLTNLTSLRVAVTQLRQQRNVTRMHNGKDAI